MDTLHKIIAYCYQNRVSTTEVADALGKSGVLPNIKPINLDLYKVGKIRTIFTSDNSNYDVHEQIKKVDANDVVLIFTHNCEGRAIIGDLICKYLLLYKAASAVIVDGMVRDAARLRREGYAVWSQGVTPLGCYNTPPKIKFPTQLRKELTEKFDGGIAICDDGGITIIQKNLITSKMLEKLTQIEMQEDIWFFCLDTLKWDTKKIVCEKAYLKEYDLLSKKHIEQLSQLSKPLDD